jgi:hypothetical protein
MTEVGGIEDVHVFIPQESDLSSCGLLIFVKLVVTLDVASKPPVFKGVGLSDQNVEGGGVGSHEADEPSR